MNKLLLAVLALGVLALPGAAQDVSDDELLAALDAARFVDASAFTFTVEVVADRPDGTEQAVVQLYFKTREDGSELFRIEFIQPEEMAGEVYLTNPDGTFNWNPDLLTPLKLSSSGQTIFGDASAAETAGVRFANGDYAVAGRETIALADGAPALEVSLAATAPDVAFQSATVVVEPDTLRPLRMRLFALGGAPLNDVTFEQYGDLDGDSYVVRQLIESQFVEGNKTLLTITSIRAADLSDDLFDQTKLGA